MSTHENLLAIDINQKLITWIQMCDLSTPLPLGVILLAIDINQKLITWIQSCDLSTQLVYLRFMCYKIKLIDNGVGIVIKTIMLCIYSTVEV